VTAVLQYKRIMSGGFLEGLTGSSLAVVKSKLALAQTMVESFIAVVKKWNEQRKMVRQLDEGKCHRRKCKRSVDIPAHMRIILWLCRNLIREILDANLQEVVDP
jgi:ribosomal protein S14